MIPVILRQTSLGYFLQYCALHVCVPIKLRSFCTNSLFFVFSQLILCYWKIFSYSKTSFLLVKKLSCECSETYLTKPLFVDLFFFTLSPSLFSSPHFPLPRSKKTEQCRNYSRLRRPNKQMQGLILDWIMDQFKKKKKIALKDIRGTIGKIWIQAAYYIRALHLCCIVSLLMWIYKKISLFLENTKLVKGKE